MEDFFHGPGDLRVMGLHPQEARDNKKVLGDCEKERDLFLMEDFEKNGCMNWVLEPPTLPPTNLNP